LSTLAAVVVVRSLTATLCPVVKVDLVVEGMEQELVLLMVTPELMVSVVVEVVLKPAALLELVVMELS
jgi:hypothetical protein